MCDLYGVMDMLLEALTQGVPQVEGLVWACLDDIADVLGCLAIVPLCVSLRPSSRPWKRPAD